MDNKKEVKKDSLFLKAIPYFDKYGILILLLIMIIALHIMQPEVFLSWRNITNVFKQISWQSMLALGVFIVIVTAGIDLSVGSIMMLSLMVLAITSKAGAAWYVVILIPIFMGALCGMVNGFGITVLRMPHPFIMTLGTLYIFRGTGNLISGGVPISGFTEEVRLLGNGRIDLTWLGLEKSQYLPVSVILIASSISFLMWVFLNHTRTGKWIYAIGGNPNAARAAGINVNKILVIVYSLCGLLAGFGALILAGRTDSGYPNAGLNAELDAIAACIIGGASFFGGRGTVLGVFCWCDDYGIIKKWIKSNGCKFILATSINRNNYCSCSISRCLKKRFRNKKIILI